MDEAKIKQIVEKILDEKFAELLKSDRYTFHKLIQILDGRNIQTGKTTGTKICLSTTEKLGVYGVTPITQRSGSAQDAVATTGATNSSPYGYTSASQANAIVTLVNELRAWAVAQGFIKGNV